LRTDKEISNLKDSVRKRTDLDNHKFTVIDAGTKFWVTIPFRYEVDSSDLPKEFGNRIREPNMNGGVIKFEANIDNIPK
jgi:hypothetical protein